METTTFFYRIVVSVSSKFSLVTLIRSKLSWHLQCRLYRLSWNPTTVLPFKTLRTDRKKEDKNNLEPSS